MLWLQQQLFKYCCSGLAYRPESALQSVTQVFEDANGNKVRLTMNQYFTNILKACGCSSKTQFEVDTVIHAADNMDPAVRKEMESTYKDHYKASARDWKT